MEPTTTHISSELFRFHDLSQQLAGVRGEGQSGSAETLGTCGLSSKASTSLMAQLVVETRLPSKGYNHARGDGGSYHPKRQAKDTQALLHFLQKHRHHPEKVHSALRQAYMVLDLARMLYLARVMVSITQPATNYLDLSGEDEKAVAIAAASTTPTKYKDSAKNSTKEYHARESVPETTSETAIEHQSACP